MPDTHNPETQMLRPGEPDIDRRHMTHALALGRRGMGRCWPNPSVGCVIVQTGAHGGRIVGRGHTAAGGRPHAEPQALAQAGAAARGAVAYVTLEPCAHHGKTPPCTDALIAARVARVVVATQDSDPRVSGRGIAQLRAAGITVDTGVCAAQAQNDHAGFFLRTTQGRPWVTLKLAQSLDGRIATAQGESRWITGPAARRHVHMDRLRHDAVMIGAGTARADDPSLTVRDLGPVAQPVRVVVSGRLDLPTDSVLARTARQVPVWLMHGPDAPDAVRSQWDDLGARRFALPDTSPDAVLQALGTAGLTRIYCEGGGQLAASLLRAGRVDELVSYAAGLAIGGDGRASLAELGIDRLAQMPRFDLVTQHDVGGDVLHRWRRRG